jgi:uncharacterized protein DUF4126
MMIGAHHTDVGRRCQAVRSHPTRIAGVEFRDLIRLKSLTVATPADAILGRVQAARRTRPAGGVRALETALLTGLGLAAPAGLNAYLPLLILALSAHFTDQVRLTPPYDVLASWPVIVVLVVLLTIEIVVDKIPGVDHLNDLIQTVIRPLVGAILMLAATGVVGLSPAIAIPVGLVAAGSVHAAKASARPVVTLGSAGVFNPIVSVGEDVVATIASIVAIFLPLLVLVVLALFVIFVVWAIFRRRSASSLPATHDRGL